MWGRTCFALYVATQQVSRYTTYRISKFIIFRDVLQVTGRSCRPNLSLFPIVISDSIMAANLLGCPSGLRWCKFRDAALARGFLHARRNVRGGANVRYCVAAKPHRGVPLLVRVRPRRRWADCVALGYRSGKKSAATGTRRRHLWAIAGNGVGTRQRIPRRSRPSCCLYI